MENITVKGQIADAVNILAEYLGQRDVCALDQPHLLAAENIPCADVIVLFGGSILAGGDVLAHAMKEHVAQNYIIVGGAGHTTGTLREIMHEKYPDWDTQLLPEAKLFQGYLNRKYGLSADFLECRSTNCGNNITFLLDLLEVENIHPRSVILCQDATMQRRMAAVLRKYRPQMKIINYSTYKLHVSDKGGELCFDRSPEGMWDMKRYISLLMGEIPRLYDDENGYGPKGKGYLAHEDVPE